MDFRFVQSAIAAAALIATPARAAVTLLLSGTAGVAELARSDLAFNFQAADPGVNGLPFRVNNAYGPQGVVYDGSPGAGIRQRRMAKSMRTTPGSSPSRCGGRAA